MRWLVGNTLLMLLCACASASAPPSMPRTHAFAPTSGSGVSIQRVSAPVDPARPPSWIGRADLERARALLSRARGDLAPRQWEGHGKNFDALQLATRTLPHPQSCYHGLVLR